MKYLGTGFSLIVGGVRLRMRIELEDAPDTEPVREDAASVVGTPQHGHHRQPPHHVRPRRT